MKKSLRKSISVLLFTGIAVIGLTGCDYNITVNSGDVLKKEDAKEFTLEKTPTETITQIDINTRLGDVEFIHSDKFYVEINYLYWEKEPQYSMEDGKLFFDDTDCIPNSYSINFNLDNRIKIYLPDNAPLKNLTIDCASGDASLTGFVAKALEINIAYGDLIMEKSAAEVAKINLASGDSTFNDFQTGSLDFEASYGDADFININSGDPRLPSNVTYDDISIQASSGDIAIDKMTSSSIEITDSYGDVTCQGITADEYSAELSSGDISISDSDMKGIRLENSYGDADVSLFGEEADYAMDLDTSYGSIKVGDNSYEDHFQKDTAGNRKLDASLSSGDITILFDGYK